ncbi:MAG: hypothetical protein EOO04_33000 [Chitinophagaceae bacterium]|nr:MAG: hypothetical protein EOO04_33000 [Chitinophagaceae bacterium]
MVTVSNYHVRERKDGTSFITLTLTGGLEMVQSQTSGKWRAVVRKCQIPASFDEDLAKTMIGTQLPGSVVRVQVDPYDFTDEQSGEVITLSHSWSYSPDGVNVMPQPEAVFD